jgi:aspartate-semialdehyde dehydrogenase
MQEKIRVGVLGATGAVGQRFVQLLVDHPWFELTALTASGASAGRRYGDACRWLLSSDVPPNVTDMTVRETSPTIDCDLVFSALPGGLAGPVEEDFASAGYGVFGGDGNEGSSSPIPIARR